MGEQQDSGRSLARRLVRVEVAGVRALAKGLATPEVHR
jgi:hypothetical protein